MPITTGIDGRAVYTVPGRALNFRVPSKQGPIKPRKPRSKDTHGTSVGPYEAVAEGRTLVPSERTSVASQTTSVPSERTSVRPYVLPSTSSDFLPTSGGSAGSDAANTSPVTNEGRKDGAAEEDQNQGAAWDILSGFGLALSSASPRERQALARHVAVKLAEGHTRAAIHAALNRGHLDGVDSPAAVLHHRLDERLHLPAKTPQPHTSDSAPATPVRREATFDPAEKADRIRRGVALARATSGAQIAEAKAHIRSANGNSPAAMATSVAEVEQRTDDESDAATAKAAHRARRNAAAAELRAYQAARAAETRSQPSTDDQGEL